MQYIIIYITAGNAEEAEKIASTLVHKKLIACSNIISPVKSIFYWQGEVCNEQEVLLMLKTTAALFDKIEAEVKKLHSYDTPEIIAVPIVKGSKDYLNWISDETK